MVTKVLGVYSRDWRDFRDVIYALRELGDLNCVVDIPRSCAP